MTETVAPKTRIALYTTNLKGGGAEWCLLVLAGALADRGYHVDLLVDYNKGDYTSQIPDGVNVYELPKATWIHGTFTLIRACRGDRIPMLRHLSTSLKGLQKSRVFPALRDYVKREAPIAIICSLGYTPFLSVWAARDTSSGIRVIAREANTFSEQLAEEHLPWLRRRRRRQLLQLKSRLYPKMDAIVSVSSGVGDDLAQVLGLERQTITTIYNPVVSERLHARRAEGVEHPWLAPGEPPIVLAVGRLNPVKGYTTLISAFALVRQTIDAKLIILGEGSERSTLEDHVQRLNLQSSVDLPGRARNPFAFMARSSVFALSSLYEGLPAVLIEAMACQCPVVATDCPSGPREILEDGRLGLLTPVGDTQKLAESIIQTLRTSPETESLEHHAAQFSVAASTDAYEALILGREDI